MWRNVDISVSALFSVSVSVVPVLFLLSKSLVSAGVLSFVLLAGVFLRCEKHLCAPALPRTPVACFFVACSLLVL